MSAVIAAVARNRISAAMRKNHKEGSQPSFAAICMKVSYVIFNKLGQMLT